MTIIERLSQHTTIERDDSGTYMVTTSHEVAAGWVGQAMEFQHPVLKDWYIAADYAGQGVTYRIPLSSLREVYGYREGEPWVWWTIAIYVGTPEEIEVSEESGFPRAHIRAVLPCAGSADALRTLHRWMEEPNHD